MSAIHEGHEHATGVTQQESTYYPFGSEQRVITNTVANQYKFTGLERDSESGLDHTLFRKFTPNLARWLSPDPLTGDVLNPQSLNRYAYVLNNPPNLIDPLGLDGDWPFPTPPPGCDIGILSCGPPPCDPFMDVSCAPNPLCDPFTNPFCGMPPGPPPLDPCLFTGTCGDGGYHEETVIVDDFPAPLPPFPMPTEFSITDFLGIPDVGFGGCDFGQCSGNVVPNSFQRDLTGDNPAFKKSKEDLKKYIRELLEKAKKLKGREREAHSRGQIPQEDCFGVCARGRQGRAYCNRVP